MPKVSKVDPIFLAAASEAGAAGTTIAEVAERVWNETGGTRGTRGVEVQAAKLVAAGKLVRKYRYFYPLMEDGTRMKSPIRRYRYYTPEHALFVSDSPFDPEE